MAKQLHLDGGFIWGFELPMAIRHARRSAERGLGPAMQSRPLPLDSLGEWQHSNKALVHEGPVGGW
eukprot:1280476-Amphidinium_carterae.1